MVFRNFFVGILFCCTLVVIPSCRKDNSEIPKAMIDIYIDPNSTQYINLNVIGGWEYLIANPPSRGILVYRFTYETFVAFERSCSYDHENPDAIIEVEPSGIILVDSICGSRFLIVDGSPFEGTPATMPLRQYRTSYRGGMLRIYN